MSLSQFLFLGLEAIGFMVLVLIFAIAWAFMERLKSH